MARFWQLPLSLMRSVNLWPRLAVAVTIGFLAMFAVLAVLILRVVDDSHDRILQERLVIAQLTARQVDGILEDAFVELETVAASPTLRKPDAGSALLSDELALLLPSMSDTWSALYLLDADGAIITATPKAQTQEALDVTRGSFFRQVVAAGGRGVSAPFAGEAGDDRFVMLTSPVAGAQGEAEVLLGGVLNLSRAGMGRILDDARRIGETGHAELVDEAGRVIAATDREGFLAPGEHQRFYVRMQQSRQEGVETVPYERLGEAGEQDDPAGDDNHIMAFAHLTHAPWGLAVGGAESETLAPVTDLRNNILLIGAGALAALWLATLVGARLLVRPVRVLTSAADRIAEGDLESPIRVVEGGEIGSLGETLETMRLRLKESLEQISRWGKELETKVAERTTELKERNRQLTALTAIATAANESQNLDRMLERCLSIVLEHTGMEAGAVRLLDKAKGRLVATSRQGTFAEFPCREGLIALDECPCGRVASTGEPMVGSRPQFEGLSRRPCLAEDAQFIAVMPLKSSKGTQGVLYLAKRQPDALGPDQIEMLRVMCNQIGVAIENSQLLQDMGKMEAQREMDRLRSEFMSAVSHELKTPLGFIKGYVTTLLRDDLVAEPETQKEFLEIIGEESDKLQNLIDDLLDAARLHSGGLTLSRTRARAGLIAEHALEKLKIAHLDRDFTLDRPDGEPEVMIDPWRIEQVIQNLVDNAAKYSPVGTAVSLSIQVEGPEVVVAVRDQGDGIMSRDMERIFEPFYRGHRAAQRSPAGTGLGLTICRGIVGAHGGRIWVESKRRRGSTFFFTLPLAASQVDAEGIEAETAGLGPDAKDGEPSSFPGPRSHSKT